MLTDPDGALFLVELAVESKTLHLTHQANLDALGLDDRINTGRIDEPGPGGDPLLETCHRLGDAIFDWWSGVPPALVYRARTLPSARSMGFTVHANFETVSARRLREAQSLLAALVAGHGFSVPPAWL
jgi:hypothetical protein